MTAALPTTASSLASMFRALFSQRRKQKTARIFDRNAHQHAGKRRTALTWPRATLCFDDAAAKIGVNQTLGRRASDGVAKIQP